MGPLLWFSLEDDELMPGSPHGDPSDVHLGCMATAAAAAAAAAPPSLYRYLPGLVDTRHAAGDQGMVQVLLHRLQRLAGLEVGLLHAFGQHAQPRVSAHQLDDNPDLWAGHEPLLMTPTAGGSVVTKSKWPV